MPKLPGLFKNLSHDRRPIDEDNGAKHQDWNGYVDDDDRALLKVHQLIFIL